MFGSSFIREFGLGALQSFAQVRDRKARVREQRKSGSAKFLKRQDGAAVLWIQLDGFSIVGDGLRFVAIIHVSLPEAVIDIA
jgi:hypothetical protein